MGPSQDSEEKRGQQQAQPKGWEYSEYPLPQVPTNAVVSSARRNQVTAISKKA